MEDSGAMEIGQNNVIGKATGNNKIKVKMNIIVSIKDNYDLH